MNVVFGYGPLARALARTLSEQGSTVLANDEPTEGPYLWRHADISSGKGVRWAAEGGHRVFVVLDEPRPTHGLFVILRHAKNLQGAVVMPLGQKPPAGMSACASLASVHVGPTWGPEEPLVAAWATRIAHGRRVWLSDPGPVKPVVMGDAVVAILEAGNRAGARWTLAGDKPARLPDLAEALAAGLGKPLKRLPAPLGWTVRRAGLDASRVLDWVNAPSAVSFTDGWRPDASQGRAGWLGDPARWR